jgi:hypothetical protein
MLESAISSPVYPLMFVYVKEKYLGRYGRAAKPYMGRIGFIM